MSENSDGKNSSPSASEIKIFDSRKKRCLFAFFLMLALFIPYALFEPFTSDTNDDTAMNLIAAGAFGENSQFLVYSNIIYGCILKALSALIPSVNWYLTLQLVFNALAAAFIGFSLAYFIKSHMLIPVLILLHFHVALDHYRSLQFTRNAYLYAICGIVLLTLACISSTHRIKLCLISLFFLLLSFMTRAESFYLMIPFALLMLFFRMLNNRRSTVIPAAFLIAAGVSCLTAGIIDDQASRKPQEWAEYFDYHFNGIFPVLDNDTNRWYSFDDDNGSVLDMTDLMLLNEYHYADFEYYSIENLREIKGEDPHTPLIDKISAYKAALGENYHFPPTNDYLVIPTRLHAILDLVERAIGWNIVIELLLLLFIVFSFIKKQAGKKELIQLIFLSLGMLAEIWVTVSFTGHTPRRATIGPLWAFEILTLITFLSAWNETSGEQPVRRSVLPAVCLLPAGILIISLRIMNWSAVPEYTETELVLNELRNIASEHYLLDSMILWGERIGVSDVRKITRTNYMDFFEKFTLSGGWLAETPLATHYTKGSGISAPIALLASAPHYHYVVRRWKAEYLVPLLNEYLIKRSGKDLIPQVTYAGNELLVIDFISSGAE